MKQHVLLRSLPDRSSQWFSTMSLVWVALLMLTGCAQFPTHPAEPGEPLSEPSLPAIAVLSSDVTRLPNGLAEALGATKIDGSQLAILPVDAVLVSRDMIVDASRDARLRNDLLDYLEEHRLLLIYAMTHREFFDLLDLPVQAYSEALPPYAVIGVTRLEGEGWALGGVVSATALTAGVIRLPEDATTVKSSTESTTTDHDDMDAPTSEVAGVGAVTINGASPTTYFPGGLVDGILSFVEAEVNSPAPGSWCDAGDGSVLNRDRLVFNDPGSSGAQFSEVIWLCSNQSLVSAQAIQETKGPRALDRNSDNTRPIRTLHTIVTAFQPATIIDYHATVMGIESCLALERATCAESAGGVAMHDRSVPPDSRLEWLLDYESNPTSPAPNASLNIHVARLDWTVAPGSSAVMFAKETTIDVGGWLSPVHQARVTHLFGVHSNRVDANSP